MRRAFWLALVLLPSVAAAQASEARMHRALDPSMERVLRTETYLRAVSGISANPERLTRGDGYVYMSDIAPQLRYLAATQDTARYLKLRAFVVKNLLLPEHGGLKPRRRYRFDGGFEPVTMYGYLWLTKALRDGWTLLSDTASAQALAQLRVDVPTLPKDATRLYVLTVACGDAMDVVDTDRAPALSVLREAKQLIGSKKVEAEQQAAGISAVEGEVDLLSCLTRVGLALRDPDVTVRYLDHLLDHLSPLLEHSGRPDLGTTADVLLTLQQVRQAGPKYFDPAFHGHLLNGR